MTQNDASIICIDAEIIVEEASVLLKYLDRSTEDGPCFPMQTVTVSRRYNVRAPAMQRMVCRAVSTRQANGESPLTDDKASLIYRFLGTMGAHVAVGVDENEIRFADQGKMLTKAIHPKMIRQDRVSASDVSCCAFTKPEFSLPRSQTGFLGIGSGPTQYLKAAAMWALTHSRSSYGLSNFGTPSILTFPSLSPRHTLSRGLSARSVACVLKWVPLDTLARVLLSVKRELEAWVTVVWLILLYELGVG